MSVQNFVETGEITKGDLIIITDSYSVLSDPNIYIVNEVMGVSSKGSIRLDISQVSTLFDVSMGNNIEPVSDLESHIIELFTSSVIVIGPAGKKRFSTIPIEIRPNSNAEDRKLNNTMVFSLLWLRQNFAVGLNFGSVQYTKEENATMRKADMNDIIYIPWMAREFIEYYRNNSDESVMKRYNIDDNDELMSMVNKIVKRYKAV